MGEGSHKKNHKWKQIAKCSSGRFDDVNHTKVPKEGEIELMWEWTIS